MSHLSVRVLHSLLVTYCPVVPVNFVIVDVKKCKILTLRREVGVKLTPDPINFLIFKNNFNLYRRDFATFNIYSLPSIWHT